MDNSVHIIYRNYKNPLNLKILINLRNFCKKKGIKLYLSNNFKLALKLDLDGVYIPSFNKSLSHNSYSFKKKFEILGSAHNIYELNIKEIQGVNKIFFSPVFKKKGKILGIYGFLKLRKLTGLKSLALGGVNKDNLTQIKNLNIYGFAGINHFKKKGP